MGAIWVKHRRISTTDLEYSRFLPRLTSLGGDPAGLKSPCPYIYVSTYLEYLKHD